MLCPEFLVQRRTRLAAEMRRMEHGFVSTTHDDKVDGSTDEDGSRKVLRTVLRLVEHLPPPEGERDVAARVCLWRSCCVSSRDTSRTPPEGGCR